MAECEVAGECGGCSWITRDRDDELAAKRQDLAERLGALGLALPGDVTIFELGADGLRDRTDLGWDGRKLGLFGPGGELVDIGPCPALSGPLRALVAKIQADPLPIARASLRARVGPDGAEGVWVDASNVDLKALMDEGGWLRRRLAEGVLVEAGQRRKPLVDAEDRLRLEKAPRLLPWWETWLEDVATPIFTVVGGFTQPGLALNRLLVSRVMVMARQAGATTWAELGSGSGNLTIPLSRLGAVRAVESDPIAITGLVKSVSAAGVADKVEIHALDMTRTDDLAATLYGVDAVLADPPRSGLGRSVDAITGSTATAIVMASCWTATLVTDIKALVDAGWRLEDVAGVDQFPRTPQTEWVVRLAR